MRARAQQFSGREPPGGAGGRRMAGFGRPTAERRRQKRQQAARADDQRERAEGNALPDQRQALLPASARADSKPAQPRASGSCARKRGAGKSRSTARKRNFGAAQAFSASSRCVAAAAGAARRNQCTLGVDSNLVTLDRTREAEAAVWHGIERWHRGAAILVAWSEWTSAEASRAVFAQPGDGLVRLALRIERPRSPGGGTGLLY